MKQTVMTALATTALAFAACGDDAESEESTESSVSPATAIQEIEEVRAGLDSAAREYSGGDAETAAETVDETYLQHFELVEGPLEEADEELNEELEDQIREELAAKIDAGAPTPEVKALIAEIEKGLDEAAEVLAKQ